MFDCYPFCPFYLILCFDIAWINDGLWGILAIISSNFNYPLQIREFLRTTHIIESQYRQLRKATKGKALLPMDDALVKMLYLVTQDVMKKWTKRVHNWGQILLQLSIFFPDRVNSYLP
ncbi:MAG: hypothetical protein AVO33_01120 [delta proteobacterium ML8_F1]|nr:MAG: hypothetical protein AVO33_01120 [delta proteobacterium ML8_F1]